MNARKIIRILSVALTVTSGVVVWQWNFIGNKVDAYALAVASYYIRGVTTALPPIDRVEVLRLASFPMNLKTGRWIIDPNATTFPTPYFSPAVKVVAIKTLTGAEAQHLAQMWRSQIFGIRYSGLCHGPNWVCASIHTANCFLKRVSALRATISACLFSRKEKFGDLTLTPSKLLISVASYAICLKDRNSLRPRDGHPFGRKDFCPAC